MVEKKLNSYLEDFYFDLYILYAMRKTNKYANIEFSEFLKYTYDKVIRPEFDLIYSKYPLLEVAYNNYIEVSYKPDKHGIPDTPRPYWFFVYEHIPFTTKFQHELNLLLREKKLKNIIDIFGG